MSPEIIEAISKLWLLALILLIIICVVLFQNQIKQLLESFTNLKIKGRHKETEIEVESSFRDKSKLSNAPEQISPQELLDTQKNEVSDVEQKSIVEAKKNNIESDRDLFFEMVSALDDAKDLLKGSKIYKKIQEQESDSSIRIKNESIYYFLSYKAGDTKALDELRKLSEKTENQNSYYWLGQIYELINDLQKAIEVYEIAAERKGTELERVTNLRRASKCYLKLGNEKTAFDRLEMELLELKSKEGLAEIYLGLGELYDSKKDWDLKAIALDKASQYKANDTSILFDAAYSYNKSGLYYLALAHYTYCLNFQNDDSATLNNIGVVYDTLLMPIESEKNYKKAFSLGNTLAAANLANKYIRAGLIEKSDEILKEARKKDNVHANIGDSIAELSRIKENEVETKKEALKEANQQQNFMRQFAEAFFIKDISTNSIFSGKWKLYSSSLSSSSSLFNIGNINITQSKSEIIGLWGDNNQFKLKGQAHNRGLIIKSYGQEEDFNMMKDIFTSSYAFISEDFAQLKMILIGKNNTSTIYIDFVKTE